MNIPRCRLRKGDAEPNRNNTKETEKKALRIGMAFNLRSRLRITNLSHCHHLHDDDENDMLRRMRE